MYADAHNNTQPEFPSDVFHFMEMCAKYVTIE